MTEIIINDVDDIADLLSALAAVSRVFLDPSAFDEERHVFSKAPQEPTPGPAEPKPPAATAPGERPCEKPLAEPEPYLPCPHRGTHDRLTDCWLCWSDVLRGAAVETDVLRTSWDAGLAQLLGGEDQR